MLACAGFDVFRREEYYLPRSYAQVPAEWIDKVFPYLNTWREQVNEVWGYDKGLAAKKFVNFMLSFLAEVIVQDGMYLISMYPDHPYTSLLLQKLGTDGYEACASQTRESVREREMIIEENLREDKRYEAILRTVERTVLKVTNLELKIDSLTSVVQLKDIILHHRNLSVNAIIETPQTAHATSTLVHNMSPVDLNATSFRATYDAAGPSREAQQPIVVETSPVERQQLQSIPNIPTTLHHIIRENMEFWLDKCYWQYLDRQHISLAGLGWSSRLQHPFGKRKDIALWVKTVAEKTLSDEENAFTINWETDRSILLRVASVLDEERGKKQS
jgi:hypothetical protein